MKTLICVLAMACSLQAQVFQVDFQPIGDLPELEVGYSLSVLAEPITSTTHDGIPRAGYRFTLDFTGMDPTWFSGPFGARGASPSGSPSPWSFPAYLVIGSSIPPSIEGLPTHVELVDSRILPFVQTAGFSGTFRAVPEPSRFALLAGLGLLGFAVRRRLLKLLPAAVAAGLLVAPSAQDIEAEDPTPVVETVEIEHVTKDVIDSMTLKYTNGEVSALFVNYYTVSFSRPVGGGVVTDRKKSNMKSVNCIAHANFMTKKTDYSTIEGKDKVLMNWNQDWKPNRMMMLSLNLKTANKLFNKATK